MPHIQNANACIFLCLDLEICLQVQVQTVYGKFIDGIFFTKNLFAEEFFTEQFLTRIFSPETDFFARSFFAFEKKKIISSPKNFNKKLSLRIVLRRRNVQKTLREKTIRKKIPVTKNFFLFMKINSSEELYEVEFSGEEFSGNQYKRY
jgi:hypothetical protein